MNITIPTPKEVAAEMKPLLQDFVNEISKNFQPKQPEEFMTREEVMNFLKVSETTLWHWKKQGKFPFYGIGNRVYCKRSEIEQFLEQNRIN